MATNPRGSGFETKFMVNLKRYSHPFKTKVEGEAWELEQRARLKLGKPVTYPADGLRAPDGGVYTISQIVEKAKKAMWTKKDQSAPRNGGLFADWCGPDMLAAEALTTETVLEYIIEYRMDELGNSGNTANRHIAAISKMMRLAVSLKAIPERFELPWQEATGGNVRFYSHEEETQMLGLLLKWGHEDYADLFMFLADTGARLGEAQKLEWQNVRGRNISFLLTKNGTDRTVYASPRVEAALGRLRRRHSLGGPFHWLKRHQLRVMWSRLRASLDWMGPDTVVHTFRHTCASRMALSGKADIYRIKKWMGHKAIATTERYSHLIPKTMEDLSNALDAYNQKELAACQQPQPEPSPSSSSVPTSGGGVKTVETLPGAFEFLPGSSASLSYSISFSS